MLPDEGVCSIETGNCFEHITDEAICCESLDLLGRKSFSRNLAEIIRGWRGANGSLVLGVEGSWGSGKSSIKNMALNVLQPDKKLADSLPLDMYPWNQMAHLFESEVNVMEFNPWRFSSQDELVTKFLNELGAIVRANASLKVADLSTLLDIYGSLVSLSGDNSQQGVINFIKQLLPKSRRSLEGLKKDIAAATKKWPKKLVVVIDDIDRLEYEEVRSVMRLVKSQVDLPNIVYLLLYDRVHVSKAFNGHNGVNDEYLSKIINYSVQVPVVHFSSVFKMLCFWINAILKDYCIAGEDLSPDSVNRSRKDMVRASDLLASGVGDFFNNLRDVKRFVGSFVCVLGNFVEGKFIVVEPLELICIESIRFFDPKVYEYVFSNKESFVSKNGDKGGISLDDCRDAVNADVSLNVLRFLFCRGGGEYLPKKISNIYKSEYFERYFSFVANDYYLSEIEFHNIVMMFSPKNVLSKKYESFDYNKDAWDRLSFEIYKNNNINIPLEFLFKKFYEYGVGGKCEALCGNSGCIVDILIYILSRDRCSMSDDLIFAIECSEDVSILHWLFCGGMCGEFPDNRCVGPLSYVDEKYKDKYISKLVSQCNDSPLYILNHFAFICILNDLRKELDGRDYRNICSILFKADHITFIKKAIGFLNMDIEYNWAYGANILYGYLEFEVFDSCYNSICHSDNVSGEDKEIVARLHDAWKASIDNGFTPRRGVEGL